MSTQCDLEILVAGATLAKTDSWWRRDPSKVGPYVVLELPWQSHRTHTNTEGGKDVEWQQRFRFADVDPAECPQLAIRLMERNLSSNDPELGRASVPIPQLADPSSPEEQHTPLRVQLLNRKGKPVAELQLLMVLKPHRPRSPAELDSAGRQSAELAAGQKVSGEGGATKLLPAKLAIPEALLGGEGAAQGTQASPTFVPTPAPVDDAAFHNPLWQTGSPLGSPR